MATDYEVSFTSGFEINFSATDETEILQNVAMIISSVMYSCPMDRAFAWDGSLLDRPMNIVTNLLASRLFSAITTYESRAEVVSVTFTGDDDGLSGLLKPTVKVRITSDG
ncbi:MAG: hypothetical protein H6Q73_3467 [Firmicutes bacterium]|nr:hypothetical protein [Bacillota bacterium]